MRLDDYEKKYAAIYADFAAAIRFILEKAIGESDGVPRPQSIQCRAKSAASLRPKLQDRGLLESQSIETEIKDLAGARLIFYTNTDVDRFLNSRLIFDNFEIDREATKIHHPIKENKDVRYRAIHYTVRMSEDRSKLPEYARATMKGAKLLPPDCACCEASIMTSRTPIVDATVVSFSRLTRKVAMGGMDTHKTCGAST
jgi:ppGpp synthetase/RelA/SpoT-type nucleotidyltranferase